MSTVYPQHYTLVEPSFIQIEFMIIPGPANKISYTFVIGDIIITGRHRHWNWVPYLGKMETKPWQNGLPEKTGLPKKTTFGPVRAGSGFQRLYST